MTRPALLALALLSACGPRGPGPVTPSPQPQAAVESVGELQVALRPRATQGLVRASLWIDAGSRDGAPPATATLAAWAAGDGLATPEATLFEARCEREALEDCLETLGRSLATRALQPKHHAALRARLVAARQRAATDPLRRAEVLAVAAAMDDASVDPLGSAEDDADLTIAAVEAFLTEHYGAARALLVLEGDLPEDASAQIGAHTAGWPRAMATRGARPAPPPGNRSAAETSTAHARALAAVFAAPPDAERAAALFDDSRLFALRGGTVLLVHARRTEVEGLAHRLATQLRLMGASAAVGGSDPTAAIVSRWLGAGDGAPSQAMGLGAACAEGRGLPELEPCAEGAATAFERAVAAAAPERRGEVTGGSADLVLANGATLRVRRVPGPLGLVVRFAGGPSESPPGAHGRAAIAAHALARSCALPTRPFVEPDGWGLVAELDPAQPDALAEGVACALAEPAPGTVGQGRQRVRALARVRPERTWVARLIQPSAPGLVAPDGSDSGAASVQELDGFLRGARVGRRVTVAIAGDVDPTEASARVAPVFGGLEPGEALEPPGRVLERRPLRAESYAGAEPRVAVALALPTEARGAPTAARAFARALAEASAAQGLRVVAAGGDSAEGLAWAFVAFDVPEASLPQVPAQVDRALRAATVDLEAMSQSLRWATGDARRAARRLAREGSLDPPFPEGSVVEGLRRATPSFTIGRRNPGVGFPSLQRREAR